MLNLEERINACAILGGKLKTFIEKKASGKKEHDKEFACFLSVVEKAEKQNPWFIKKFSLFALEAIADMLSVEKLGKWATQYPELYRSNEKRNIAIILAGNIPLVGFHDLLCSFMANHYCICKLSGKDELLMKYIVDLMIEIDPRCASYFSFADDHLKEFDAVIATGSNNTSRYFEAYFGKFPHIIRKNRNSIGIIAGNESKEELMNLADDIMLYFGMGCRSISKLFIPEDFQIEQLFENLNHYSFVTGHTKYMNNYDYYRSVYLLNKVPFLENGFLHLKEDTTISSPISVLFYEKYEDIKDVYRKISEERDKLQIIVGIPGIYDETISFGKCQKPELWDYADRTDTLNFLLHL